MTQLTSPFLGANYGWSYGESGWNTGMDENILKFSFMFDRNINAVVNSLPSAVNGNSYFLTTDNRLYFAVNNTYYSSPTPKWFTFIIKDTGVTYQFDGTSVNILPNNASLNSRLSSVELTISTLGSAAFLPASSFSTPAELDVVASQANTYTDTQLLQKVAYSDLADSLDSSKGAAYIARVTQVVDNIAALKALSITGPNKFAQPLGYYQPSDGGAGPVRRLVTGQPAGTFVDNGGSVILPNGNNGSAAWVWIYSGPVDIRWYGATTSALVNNTPFILSAGQNGSTVIIPRGFTFSVNGVMFTNKSNFKVTGGGELFLLNGSNKPVLGATSCTNFSFDGVRINGNKAGQTELVERNNGACLFAYLCSDFSIINNYAYNGYSGAMIVAVDNASDPTELKTNARINYNTLLNGGVVGGPMLCDGIFANSDSTEVIGNIVDGMTDYGFAGDYSQYLVLERNVFRNIAFVCIGLVGVKSGRVISNTMDRAGGGLFITLSGNPATAPYVSSDILVADNQATRIVAQNGVSGDSYYADPSATLIKFRGNSARDGTRGFGLSGANISLTDSDVTNMTGRGVFCSGAGSFVSGFKTINCTAGNYFGETYADKTVIEDAPTGGAPVSAFLNSWLNFGAPYKNASYQRQAGRLYLTAVLKSGTVGSTMFNLPLYYRPIEPIRISVPGDAVGGVANILIDTNGNVSHVSGPVTEVHLTNISFPVA